MMSKNRNVIMLGMAAAGAVSCTDTEAPENPGKDDRPVNHGSPNVVLIVADDMGYGDISGLNADSKIHTPNIDALCSSGLVFTDAHSASSMSTPSRYSILTGRYPWRTTLKQGVLQSNAPAMITDGRRTLGNLFHDAGYNTACIGKWHLGMNWKFNGSVIDYSAPIENGPTERGFDYFYGIAASLDMPPYVYIENDRVTQAPSRILPERTGIERMRSGEASEEFIPEEVFPNMTEHAVSYIENNGGSGKPFFLYLPLTAPHTPILPSPEFKGRSSIGAYGDFVIMIDDMVQQIVFALKRAGVYENTIIIFTADNGCAHYVGTKNMEKLGHYPSYGYRGYKSDIFEGGHRIPLIVSWNGKTTGQRNGSPVCLSDFYATFAQMLGTHPANGEAEDSYSFYGALTGSEDTERKDIVATSNDGSFSLTRDGMKVIFTATSGGWSDPASGSDVSGLPPLQIYNLGSDRSESTNLYGTDINIIVDSYKATMRDYVNNGRSTPGIPVSNDTGNDWEQTKPFTDGD